MTIYTFTITATFETDDLDSAWDEFAQWITDPHNLTEDGVDVVEVTA
jgi:hypothetical protein